MKRSSAFILFIFSFLFASAQQVGMYSHAFFKPMAYNPAYTGYDASTNAMILSRSQWTGFKGSPQLNLFTLDGNFLNEKIGIGLSLISDRKGITNRIGGNLYYSYRLKINDDAHLRFGIAAGVIDQTIDFSKALVEDASDPLIFGDSQRKTSFDANAGLAFIWKGLEIGVSAPQLIGNKMTYVDDTSVRAKYTQVRHYMGTLKYRIALSKDKGLFVIPQALVRYVPNTPFQYDGTLNLEWKDKFWIGATYKSDYAIAAHAGVCIHKQLYIGYAYDIILGDVSKYSGISHEIMVNFKFGKQRKEEPETPLNAENNSSPKNDEIKNRLDSLETVIREDQDRIREDGKKIKELSDKLEQQAKAQQVPQTQTQTQTPAPNTSAPVSGSNPSNTNTPPVSTPSNENKNAAAVETNTNKVLENDIWLVTNSTTEFKDIAERAPKKGFYVVAGTFIYRDFAEAEVKRLKNSGFGNSSWLFSEKKQYNYVFISKPSTKEEAIKKAKEARAAGIKDAWVLQLVE
jgi:type IX secretion system PorP/SprF family membrane protein